MNGMLSLWLICSISTFSGELNLFILLITDLREQSFVHSFVRIEISYELSNTMRLTLERRVHELKTQTLRVMCLVRSVVPKRNLFLESHFNC